MNKFAPLVTWLKSLVRAIVAGVSGMGVACVAHQRGVSDLVALLAGAAVTGLAIAILAWAKDSPLETGPTRSSDNTTPLTPAPSPAPHAEDENTQTQLDSMHETSGVTKPPDMRLRNDLPIDEPLKLKSTDAKQDRAGA
jgi:hypothetical protein